jgi:hypothetical protein
MPFFAARWQSAYSSLRAPGDGATRTELTVRCARLDDVLPADRRVDFLKLDVEGAELSALQGATETLRRHHPPVLFECTQDGLNAFHLNAHDVFSFLDGNAYKVFLPSQYLISGCPLDAIAFERAQQYPFQAFNFVAAFGA